MSGPSPTTVGPTRPPSTAEAEDLLLRAVCGPAADGSRHWNQLSERLGGDTAIADWMCDGPRRRLLPLVGHHRNRLSVGADTSELAEWVTVEAWGLNERLLDLTSNAISTLGRADIPVMALKGLALLGDVYPDHRLRPLGDADLLVPPDRASDALRILCEAGWQLPDGTRWRRGGTGVNLGHPHGPSLDLHWRAARTLPHHGIPECWQGAVPVADAHPLADTGVLRPSTEDHLIILAAHRLRQDNRRLLHLTVDVHHLLVAISDDRNGPIQPAVLAERAERELATMRLAEALAEQSDRFGTPLPVNPDTLRANRRHRRLEQRIRNADRAALGRRPGWQGEVRRAVAHVRTAAPRNSPRALLDVGHAVLGAHRAASIADQRPW